MFKTFGDPVLELMVAESGAFLDEMKSKERPRWLSFVGESGTGKTYLSKQIVKLLPPYLENHRSLKNGVHVAFWPRLLSTLRNGDFWRVDDLVDANFLMLDEVSTEHDPSGFARDKLCELLSQRCEKWTLLTTNLTVEKLCDIDVRIASRIIRDDSILVNVNTIDFALR